MTVKRYLAAVIVGAKKFSVKKWNNTQIIRRMLGARYADTKYGLDVRLAGRWQVLQADNDLASDAIGYELLKECPYNSSFTSSSSKFLWSQWVQCSQKWNRSSLHVRKSLDFSNFFFGTCITPDCILRIDYVRQIFDITLLKNVLVY